MASRATRDHEEILRWAADHDACPAVVSRTGGMLRFEFDPAHAQQLTPVDWDDFFQVLDEKGLELVYDDKPGSRFHKIVYPEAVVAKAERKPPVKPARARKRMPVQGGAKRRSAGPAAGKDRRTPTRRATAKAPASRSRRAATPAKPRRKPARANPRKTRRRA